MRKSSRFMGVLAVGALAVGVSVYAAPRADGTARGKSEASRLVTGTSQHLQAIVDGGVAGTGSYVGMQNDYLGLDGSSQRLSFTYRLGGWVTVLDTYQISVDQGLLVGDGTGTPLTKPVEACTTDADCAAVYGPGSKCSGSVCDVAYQDAAHPDFAVGGISACSQVNLACGSTKLPGFAGETDDGRNWYGGDLVLDLVAGRGFYFVCPLSTAASFLVLDTGDLAIQVFNCATVEVPVGKCCILSDSTCQTETTLAECDGLGGIHFPGNNDCSVCIECVVDDDCKETPDDLCTGGTCIGGFCDRPLTFDPSTQCCNGTTGAVTTVDDGDACTDDACDGGGNCGVRDAGTCGADAHSPSALGTACDDDNARTFDDVCDGANSAADGGCGGTDANSVPCLDADDCLAATGGALECQETGFCYCTLSPALTINIDPGDAVDPNCFDDGEKVTATVHVGPSLDNIVGGELAMTYDPSCLTLGGVITLAPFNNILFIDVDTPGSIFIAVGIDLGGAGLDGGNFDLVAFSFAKLGGCAGCDICFTDVNPRHTRLTNNVGQAVTVVPECSKEVRGDGVLSMATPAGGKYNAACNGVVRDVNWDAPTAADSCLLTDFWCGGLYQNPYTGDVVDVGGIGVDPYTGGTFPIGDATFCCNAANDCGETVRDCWTVTVNDQTSLDVDLQLSPTMAGQPGDDALTRCIKFEVFTNCGAAPLVFSENVSFGGLFQLIGKVNTSIKIPVADQFACITARDQLHTLRSCYIFGADDCDADGTLHATFKGDPFFGGNWLVGGNLDGFKKDSATASLNAIDITDFGMFVSQYPGTVDANTACGTEGPHADINGDGLVDLLDFTFISMNFLEDSKDCCCPGGGAASASPSGRTRISLKALRESGMGELAVADLDNDGDVDLDDVTALLRGHMPPTKGSVHGRSR